MASRRAANGFCRSNLQFKLRKLHPSKQNCDAKRHLLRSRTLEQKRHVFWWMNMKKSLIDTRRNGETAIPQDARVNAANEFCMRQR
jgi:hypothetical protein